MKLEQWIKTELGQNIWEGKYRYNKESFDEWLERVSGGDPAVKDLIEQKKFLFGGRILASRGVTDRKVTYSNCYVLPQVEDSIEGIYDTAKNLARTFSYGGGVGIDISKLRPKGAPVNNAAKTTSGAVSFMDTFSQVSSVIGQEGRRGALMISMDCYHRDIGEFIDAKKNTDKLEGCNISVRCSDKFMEDSRVEDETFNMMMKLAENNWNYAEPGILYWDTINDYNLLTEYIKNGEFEYAGVNPCVIGDTIIQTTDGPIAIKDLVGKTPDVLCMDNNGKLVIKKATKVWKTRENAELVKIIHYRGELICTPDHLIYTTNRGWVKAIDLQPKDKLNGLGISMKDEKHCCFKLSTDNKYHAAHRFILSHYVDIKGKDVHHLDDNPLNNSRQNLVALSHSVHSQITNKGHECYANKDEATGRFIEGKTGRRTDNLQVNKDVTGKNFIVKEVIKLDYTEDVYDMTVEDVHNFIANNIVIHNCAEEPLPAGGSCLLGAMNLSEYVEQPFTDKAAFNLVEFRHDVKIAIKALNDVLDEGLELHPLEIQRQTVRDWRQIGLGIMGFADMLIKLGIPYGSGQSITIIHKIGKAMNDAGLLESARLAKEKGAFVKCDNEKILKSTFMQHIKNDSVLNAIESDGLRNSQLFTIAPTGSISTMIGVSGGVEPLFDIAYTRTTKSLHGEDKDYVVVTPIVEECLKAKGMDFSTMDPKDLPKEIVWSKVINPMDRVDVQSVWQDYIDASISSTVNLAEDTTVEQVYTLYLYAWSKGCKGLTIFRDGCARTAILNSTTEKKEVKQEQPKQEFTERGVWKPIPSDTLYIKKKVYTGCGKINLFIGFSPSENRVVEVYVKRSGKGGCEHNIDGEVIAMSGMLRLGGTLDTIEKAYRGLGACPSFTRARERGEKVSKGKSCPSAILNVILETEKELQGQPKRVTVEMNKDNICIDVINNLPTSVKCPDCGEPLQMTGGCNVCPGCGYTKCD